jgi:hypothetical protein|tara:strand:+ start:41 stop:895 length:855 start_codon:yes stop_codon:yes gene_type:complete
MKFLTNTELKEIQSTGGPVLFKHPLTTNFPDRLDKAKILFDKLTVPMFETLNNFEFEDEKGLRIEHWHDEDVPDKIYAHRYGGPAFGYDLDVMVGPKDWEGDSDAKKVGDHVLRRKIYLFDWTRERMADANIKPTAEIEYFLDLLDVVKPILENYNEECLSDQKENVRFYLTKMMLIEYSTPFATDETVVEHRKFNSERFGPSHCDEALLGLHVGESIKEIQTRNHVNGDWTYLPDNDTCLLLFGEDSANSDWNPTYHRMIHNPNDGSSDSRYVILIDYQARYK